MELKAYLTAAGSAVVAKLLASQGALEFTRAELGSGSVSSEAAARARTSLVDKAADADLVSARLSNGQAAVDVQFSNAALTADLSVSELAIYCKDPSDSASEVLYCYASFGDTPDAILRASAALYARVHKRERLVRCHGGHLGKDGTVAPFDIRVHLRKAVHKPGRHVAGSNKKDAPQAAGGNDVVDGTVG